MIGKYLFLWKIAQLESGRTVSAMIEQAVELGLGMVAIKIADGAAEAGGSGTDEQIRAYVDGLHLRGIQVWGWHYLYGGRRIMAGVALENVFSTPESEAKVAINRIRSLGLDGYILDPEREYKTAPVGRADRFMHLVRAGLGSLPIGLCSYRFPMYHRELPWAEFLARSDYHMPQVYWGHGPYGSGLLRDGRYQAVVELDESMLQLSRLKNLPFLPVGRLYAGDGHVGPRPAEITAFLARAKAAGCHGAGFWNWDSLRPGYPGSEGRLAAVRAYDQKVEQPGITCPKCKTFIPMVTKSAAPGAAADTKARDHV